MKLTIYLIFLLTGISSVFGQSLSEDVDLYLKDEIRYKKKAPKVIKHNLKENNKSLVIEDLDFTVIPTFKAKYLANDLDSLLMSLVIDKGILLEQILMFEQKDYLAGFTFCESNKCDVYLYSDSPEEFKKVEKAANQLIIEDNYDLIFRVEDYPQFWFLWKDNRLSLYSFSNETLYKDKNEFQSLITVEGN